MGGLFFSSAGSYPGSRDIDYGCICFSSSQVGIDVVHSYYVDL